ncbi:HvfC/BufC N-terminal domain-containing protein [Rhodobacter maris]|uniref:Putative DNA-binding domain-containing protein n=1 Tax=Rhodobacter maris TaxID=446682 RepID=A0A285RKI1_9RHOB|nr:putative DNA-binding domain-containing protein [Rhodobacter maris]SOB94611.1 hypothetical protein SAMN05877831_101539 [Rhodobacter maris]
MNRHDSMLARFSAALAGGALPEGVTACAPAEAARRFDVYRNNVTVSLCTALEQRFPVISRLVGVEFFAALARHFCMAHPPQSPVLHEWGEAFPGYLEACAPLAGYPYMGDVARIELARGRAFHATDAAPIAPARLAAADPGTLRLALHPSVCLMRLATPAVSIWARNQPGAEAHPIRPGPEIALILRDRAYQVPVRAISSAEASLIAALGRGAPLLRAAAEVPDLDPTELLRALMQAGALCERAAT